MHPAIRCQLAHAQMADLRHQARREALARVGRCPPGLHPWGPRRPRAVPGTPRPFSPSWRATHRSLSQCRPSA
jgi:hypothetical protein